VGDAMLTLDFAKALVENEKLGHNDTGAPDYLQISFSSTDYIGHLFGPSSLETEDNILRLDRTLADLFQFIDEKVGLDQTLIVLSGDHGAPEAPRIHGRAGAFHRPVCLRLVQDRGPPDRGVAEKIRPGGFYFRPQPPLSLPEPGRPSHPPDWMWPTWSDSWPDELMKIPGIAYAQTRSDLLAGRITESPVQNQIRRSFHPTRSGNIHMVPEQYWFLHSTEEAEKMGIGSIAAIHGSPWAYDTFVPIFFAGHGVPAQAIARRVAPTDIAATVTAYLGVKPPSGSVGVPLVEVLNR
jgi:hypothetical protein